MKELLHENFGYESLAEVSTPETFEESVECLKDIVPENISRLKYLYEAQARFAETLEAWREGDIEKIGANFRADGIGLRDDYEISGPELESMCDIARQVKGVHGERMLGGGDKGASGALIKAEAFDLLKSAIEKEYPKRHPDYSNDFAVYSCRTADGITCQPLMSLI
ncbi:MAG: hypothetical protein ACKVJU_15980 [Verrucomicrobiales bacterium]